MLFQSSSKIKELQQVFSGLESLPWIFWVPVFLSGAGLEYIGLLCTRLKLMVTETCRCLAHSVNPLMADPGLSRFFIFKIQPFWWLYSCLLALSPSFGPRKISAGHASCCI